jgi:hypothetical protein
MAKWEYQAVSMVVRASKAGEIFQEIIEQMNQMGADGWEMVTGAEVEGVNWSGQITSKDAVVFFKRQRTD